MADPTGEVDRITTARSCGAFARDLVLPGWSRRSSWGYDVELECYWVELWRDEEPGPRVRIGPEHLISTVPALARAMAFALEVAEVDAYLALTA